MKTRSVINNKLSNERHILTLRNIKELLNYKSTSEKRYVYNLTKIITSHKITKNISTKNERS